MKLLEARTVVRGLLQAQAYAHKTQEIRLLETHISWIILTGDYAYKLKKPVDLGFLNFSTLEKRHFFCQEEVRINRRTAPDLYLGVVPIVGTPETPKMGGPGEPFEYAVKMRQFPQTALLDRRIGEGLITPELVDLMADQVAAFHQQVEVVAEDSLRGTPAQIRGPALENFSEMKPLIESEQTRERLARLEAWTRDEFSRRQELMQKRHDNGSVQECHGDLHLGNLAAWNGLLIFDAIEFNENLRWIDRFNEIAFLAMDFEHRGRRDYA